MLKYLGKEYPIAVCDGDEECILTRLAECEKAEEKLKDTPSFQSLSRALEFMEGDRKAELYTDFAPLSFTFRAFGMFGGIIFHGSHDGGGDGGAPTFSVNLSPTNGWAIHT